MSVTTSAGDKRSKKEKLYSAEVFLWIISFVKNYLRTFILFIVCGLFVSTVELIVPKLIQYLIDHVFPLRDYFSFFKVLVAVLSMYLLVIIVTAYRNRLQRVLQEMPSFELQKVLFLHLRKLGFAYYDQHPVGETLSLFRDEVSNIQSVYRKYLPKIIHEGSMLFIAAVLLIHTNPLMSVIVLPCFLSYYLIGPYFERKAAQWAREVQKRRTNTNQILFDTISGLQELKANSSVKWGLNRLSGSHRQLNQANQIEDWNAYLRGTTRRVTTGLGAFFVFATGIHLIENQSLTIGEFVSFTILYFYVINNLTRLVTLTTEQNLLMVQAERLYRFYHTSPVVIEPTEPVILTEVKGYLSFQQVSFSYRGNNNSDQPVLKGINLSIAPGERVALVGKSGHGKSTIVKLLGRFYDPTGGHIQLDHADLRQLSLSQLRDIMGYVFQETVLLDTTVKENIRFGNPEATDTDIESAAKAAYAHDFIMALPQGYDTLVGERGNRLSGGQKQRIAIARMFVKNPKIIILDEATSSLDNYSEFEVKKALDALMEGRTAIAIAHRLSTVQDYDRIILIEDGTVKEEGSYSELIDKKGLFYQLLIGHSGAEERNEDKPTNRNGSVVIY